MISLARKATLFARIVSVANIAAAAFVANMAHAETASFAWKAAVYGQGNTDSIPGGGDAVVGKKSMAIDAAGNIYVTGTTFNGANADFLTVKYNAAGAIQWRTVTNGASNGADVAYALAVDASGNVAVTGLSHNGSNYDYLTVKYDANGAELWRATLNGASNGDDEAHAIAFDGMGNIIVTGSSFFSTNRNNYNYVTVKYSAAGVELWKTSMEGAGFGTDRANDLVVDKNSGNIVVTGYSANGTNLDYLTVMYGPNGNELHRASMDGGGDDVAFAVTVDGGGNIYVTGKSLTSRTISTADYDMLTVKYDSNLVEVWRRTLNGPGSRDDAGFAVAVDAGGNVIVTGQVDFDPALGLSVTNPRFMTISYSPSGAENWRAYLNGSGTGTDVSTALAIDGSGNVFVTGFAANGMANDLAVVKYAPNGSQLWQSVIGGVGSANGGTLMVAALDPLGNIVVAGYRSTGADNDFLVVKYNSSGAEQWRASEGLNDHVSTSLSSGEVYFGSRALAVDAAGNVYITGRSDFGGKSDYITAKIDAGGVTQWRAMVNGAANGLDQAYAIALDATGNTYVTGDSYSANGSDFLTVKYSPSGTELWRVLTNGAPGSQDLARALAVDSAGDVIVTGLTLGGGDFLTVKYDTSGNEKWRMTASGAAGGIDDPVAMAVDAARNIYVTGKSFDGTSYGYLTVKYDSAGVQKWVAAEPGSSITPKRAFAVAVDTAGNVIVAGKPTIKYNPAGVELWRVTDFQAYTVATDAAGNVYLGGSGGLTVKYAAGGSELWRATVGATGGGDIVNALALDADLNIYVTSQNFLNGISDFTTIKYGPAGVERWRVVTPTLGNVTYSPTALALDGQRGVIVAGNTLTVGLAPAMSVIKYRQLIPAPTINSVAPGNGAATVSFTPPVSDGGSPISGYTATCNPGAFSVSGLVSPFNVTGLTNGSNYTCSVTATNAYGISPASALLPVTPSATAPLALLTVHSRKLHGALGPFDWRVDTGQPIGGAIAVEPRAIGTGHILRFRFNGTVTAPGSAAVTPVGNASLPTAVGDTVAVTLSGIPDGKRVTVSLTGVNGSTDVGESVGFMVGDVNRSYAINASDISAVKARIGKPVDLVNYLFDLDTSGAINQIDLSMVKARSGATLP